MDHSALSALLGMIRFSEVSRSSLGPHRSLACPWLTWDAMVLEESLGITIPPDLRRLWDECSGVVMHWDMDDGQWGLVLWSPDQALVRHQRHLAHRRPEDWRQGDFIIGEFLGDSDLLVVRCDPDSPDFGSVVIAAPIDWRDDWYAPATSLTEFLVKFWETGGGEKFWE